MRDPEIQLAICCAVETAARQLATLAPAIRLQDLAAAELTALEERFAAVHNLTITRLHDIRAERRTRSRAAEDAAEEERCYGR